MKKKRSCIWSVVLLSLCLMACANVQDENAGTDIAEPEKVEQDMSAAGEDSVEGNGSVDAAQGSGDGSETGSGDEIASEGTTHVGNVYTYGDMTVEIPDSWLGRVNVIENDNGFYFVQKASIEAEPNSGYMCGFMKTKELVYNFAGERPLACTADTFYYAQEPTDVPCANTPEIMQEYGELMSKCSQVERSFKVDDKDVQYAYDEYMLFGSDIVEVPEYVLRSLSTYELWIARNEIYARHGRPFKNNYLQRYFATRSWYHCSEKGKDFDDSVLSEIEKKNVETIKMIEDEMNAGKTYPIRYKANQTVQEDLDGDGRKEKISVSFRSTGYPDEPQAFLTIDGKEYDLEKMGVWLTCANEDEFYITDIWSWIDGLEVAVMDYGPSDDLETHFFRYDGQLFYVGSVAGFPFKEYLGFDGFYMDGVILSERRADVISSAYAYGTWWADSTSYSLVENEGMFEMAYDGAHQLLVDLPLYEYANEDADTFVMKAGQEVCFVETDAKEWVGVKSKQDRIVGYILYRDGIVVPVNKEPNDVFGDLQYFD